MMKGILQIACLLALSLAPAWASTRTDCTTYASPSGGGDGTSPSKPITLTSAISSATAGSVICVMGGNYSLADVVAPTQSGTSSRWITVEDYGDSPAVLAYTGGATPASGNHNMFQWYHSGYDTFPENWTGAPSYWKVRGLTVDGNGYATNAFLCQGGHHLEFADNYVKNTLRSAIATVACDYVTANRNEIWHNGYNPNAVTYTTGATSAISFNSTQYWPDKASSSPGFHNIAANNARLTAN